MSTSAARCNPPRSFYNHVQDEFPDKPIVVGEAGWPSEGRTRGRAEASTANEAYFIRAFVQFAHGEGLGLLPARSL